MVSRLNVSSYSTSADTARTVWWCLPMLSRLVSCLRHLISSHLVSWRCYVLCRLVSRRCHVLCHLVSRWGHVPSHLVSHCYTLLAMCNTVVQCIDVISSPLRVIGLVWLGVGATPTMQYRDEMTPPHHTVTFTIVRLPSAVAFSRTVVRSSVMLSTCLMPRMQSSSQRCAHLISSHLMSALHGTIPSCIIPVTHSTIQYCTIPRQQDDTQRYCVPRNTNETR